MPRKCRGAIAGIGRRAAHRCWGAFAGASLVVLTLVCWASVPVTARGATAANANSPLGMNLLGLGYFSVEQPFLNVFKTEGVTHTSARVDHPFEFFLGHSRRGVCPDGCEWIPDDPDGKFGRSSFSAAIQLGWLTAGAQSNGVQRRHRTALSPRKMVVPIRWAGHDVLWIRRSARVLSSRPRCLERGDAD